MDEPVPNTSAAFQHNNTTTIIHYSENKQEYSQYHNKIAEAFKQDCEKLLLAYEATRSLTFESFAAIWREALFSMLFVGEDIINELSMFADTCYIIIKKYIRFSKNVHVQVGALYLLYSIYRKQEEKEAIPIRLTREEYTILLTLVQNMQVKGVDDVAFVFYWLKLNEAFSYVATINSFGLEGKYLWHERKLKNDIFQDDTADPDKLHPYKKILFDQNFTRMENICADYDKAFKAFSENHNCAPILTGVDFIKEIKDSVENLNKTQVPSTSVFSGENLEKDNIGNRRSVLKQEAYKSKNEEFRK